MNLKTLISSKVKEFYQVYDTNGDNSYLYENILKITQEALIEETLKYTDGVKVKAAKILGISRTTLQKKIQQLNIDV